MGTHVRERESHVPSRRQALCLGAAAVAVPAGVVAFGPTPDPIFARIAEHRQLMAPVRACDTTVDGEDRLAELVDIADEQFAELLGTVPTTLPGLLALVRYVGVANPDLPLGTQEDADGTTFEELLLDTLAAALGRLVAEGRA
ncbi:hypothetical protein J2X65_004620 [Ancylobacter sp. 3268]|uniref:hypothetical protein n=1 Tax=Ancylobacter sp. 3268 TaxID=2817752 RepID=UPI00285699CC|nr:hypothetical protein [Ancylobacter sp. 3268]MDR6955241.1 hypothetical protein [Ancylobacter sp. 3268]